MAAPRAKRHRLPDSDYIGAKSVAFTICERTRRRALCDPKIVTPLAEILGDSAQRSRCTVPLYCFMPDHCHVVILGNSDSSRPKAAMDDFKNRSGRWLADNVPGLGWQKSYYDRIIRRTEDWRAHLRYIALNPVRAGLTDDMFSWPFTGSIGHDVEDILDGAFW